MKQKNDCVIVISQKKKRNLLKYKLQSQSLCSGNLKEKKVKMRLKVKMRI